MPIQTSKSSEINVAILAGGLGTRLAPVVPGRQKVVANVVERPFLKYILEQLNKAGFKNVVMCTGHLGNQVQEEFGNRYKSLFLQYSREQSTLGTAGALRFALPLLKSENILVLNGDTFCDVDFKGFWRFHVNKKSKASIVLSKVSDTSRFGTVTLGKDHSITGFREKKAGSGSGLVNAGIYLINKNFIAQIPEWKEISIENEVFPNWIGKGFYGYKGSDSFIDIGTPESYAAAQKFFAKFRFD